MEKLFASYAISDCILRSMQVFLSETSQALTVK